MSRPARGGGAGGRVPAKVGQNGTGKTTAVRTAIANLPVPRGAVYFQVPETPFQFSTDLADTVGFVSRTTKQKTTPQLSEEPLATWIPLSATLKEVAERYLAKHGRPMVLVLDGVDLIAKENPVFLITLQNFAKTCADDGLVRVVFVTSEGATLPLLSPKSAWSRADEFEVGDIPDDLAIDYLVQRGVPLDRAIDAVQTITGGRLILLNKFSSKFSKKTNDEYRKEMEIKTDAILVNHIPVDHRLFKLLVQHRAVPRNEAKRLLSDDLIRYLLDNNILAVHPNETFTVHSRHVQMFFETKAMAAD